MKKYLKITRYVCLLAIAGITRCYGQSANDLKAGFENYTKAAPQEKIFVHTDKNTYTTGEIMWFKLYYVDGTYQHPADMSKVTYVEVLNKDNDPVIQAKIELKDGTGSGSVFVPVNLESGNYILRAYTGWMKNFGPEYYFHQQVTIINPLKETGKQAKISPPEYDIQFFPEGGNLVNGINSTVAIKAVNQLGVGVDFKGAILNKNNDTVARFSSYKFGMGRFAFKPDDQSAYRAVINIDGKTIQKDLPKIYNSGYVMHVDDDHSNQLSVTVNTNTTAANVYLFVHTRGAIKAVESANVENGVARFAIDKSRLGDGISHLTVFDNDRRPVCERLYFKRPAKQLIVAATSDQLQYNARRKVDIAIDAKNGNNKPAMANLSLSIYKIDELQDADSQDIETYLWLTSDLKGKIESADYYLKNSGVQADEATDNLMLTQGWSRFNWGDVMKNNVPSFSFLPEYNGPIVQGKLTNQLTGKPVKDIITYLAIPGKRVQIYPAISDSLGRLIFNMKSFYGPGEIVVQTNTNIDTTYHIDIQNPFSEQYAKINLPQLIPGGDPTEIANNNLDVQVQNIYNGEKLRQFYDLGIDSSAFYGPPYKTYLLDNYTRFTTMEEVMREYVSEVNITHSSKDGFHIKVISGNGYLREDDPMVIIDGVPFFNMNKLFATDPLKIRKLEDVPYVYYWGPSVEEGVFSFTSYKGDLAGVEIDPHAVVMDYEGLEEQRVFYSPQYDTDKALNSRLPDFRTVLYWSPNVNTDASGKSSLSFYTSDQSGKYIGVIQGMSADGEAGSQTFTFQVVK
jgi:hypothetical protein